MEFDIYYFSGTGNTLFLVNELSRLVKSKGANCRTVNIENISEAFQKSSAELVLAFPVYAYAPPKIVERFIDHLEPGKGKDINLFLNYGLFAGNAYKITSALLTKKGYKVKNCFGIRMPANYIVLYNPHTKDKTTKKRFGKAELKLENYANTLMRSQKDTKIIGNLLALPLYIFYIFFKFKSDWMGQFFKAGPECNSCGLCVELCPEHNIILEEDSKRPKWGKKCQQCVRCIHVCPQKAINWSFVTNKRRRYINPFISPRELIKN